jgi:TPR repeat protein
VPEDREEARDWYRRAAERGHAHAQMMLGRFLARGLGGEQDIREARAWLERAKAAGVEEAGFDLERLSPDSAETALLRPALQ